MKRKAVQVTPNLHLLRLVMFSVVCGFNVTHGSDSSATTAASAHAVYCPAAFVEKFTEKNTSYGTFELKERVATLEPSFVHLPCPLGAKSMGKIRIPTVTAIVNVVGAEESWLSVTELSGVTARCSAMQLGNGTWIGEWVLEEEGIRDCRDQDLNRQLQEVRKVAQDENISVKTYRTMKPKIFALMRSACIDHDIAEALIACVGRFLELAEMYEDEALVQSLFEIIQDYLDCVGETISAGELISVKTKTLTTKSIVFPLTEGQENQPVAYVIEANVRVPTAAVEMAREVQVKPMLKMMTYSSEVFSNNWNYGGYGSAEAEEAGISVVNGWRALELKMDGVKIENLTEPIIYRMAFNDTPAEFQWVCVYWDTEKSEWSNRGMISKRSGNNITCESNHLTVFSVILDPLPISSGGKQPGGGGGGSAGDEGESEAGGNSGAADYDSRYSTHLQILSIFSTIGSATSMIGLALTMLTFAIFRSLRRDKSNRILLQMSISLFFLHTLSLLSESKFWNGKCLVPAMMLHYFLLSSLAWMLVEGLYMHTLLIQVFVQPFRHFMAIRVLLAWGCPLMVVGVCAGVDRQVYEEGRSGWCIMAGHLNYAMYYTAYLAPAALMLLINVVIFARIMKVLGRVGDEIRKSQQCTGRIHSDSSTASSETGLTKAGRNISPTQIKGAVTVVVLLGIGWTLGFFAIGPLQLPFRYLFCLCNAGQGFFIFLFRVVFQPQANRAWRRALTRGLAMDGEISSIGSYGRKAFQRDRDNNSDYKHSRSPSFGSSGDIQPKLVAKPDTSPSKRSKEKYLDGVKY